MGREISKSYRLPSVNKTLTPEQAEEIEYIQDRVLAKFPMLGVTLANLETFADDAIGTAATNGECVIYSPRFFETLNDNEKIFVYAHELMHVAFEHMWRLKNKDRELWNDATDAVINQTLQQEGLPIKEGLVNIPEALGHSAEEVYVYLLKRKKEWEKKQKQQQKKQEQQPKQDNPDNQGFSQNQGSQPQQSGNGGGNQPSRQQNSDDSPHRTSDEELFNTPHENTHSMWDEAAEQHEREEAQKSQSDMQDFEKDFVERNRTVREQQNSQAMAEHKKQVLKKKAQVKKAQGGNVKINGRELQQSKRSVLNWKKYLAREIMDEDDIWSYRRANAGNDYSARMESLERQGQKAKTEVMLDISGSVRPELLREFLRQLAPMLKYTELSVGYFNDEAYSFTPIKKVADIEKLWIPHPDGGTDLDAAVRAFSDDKDINKIVFTDGYGDMPRKDLKRTKNLIWLLYDNHDEFKPVCGKVFRVDTSEIMRGGRPQRLQSDKSDERN